MRRPFFGRCRRCTGAKRRRGSMRFLRNRFRFGRARREWASRTVESLKAKGQTRDLMVDRMKCRPLALGAVLTVLLLASCSQLGIGFTKIGDLLANPQRSEERRV